MRKITQDIVNAFINNQTKHIDNTSTNGWAIYLHGHKIAWRDEDGSIKACLCGWPTNTTRERLNGLCDALGIAERFFQHRHTQRFGIPRSSREISSTEIITLIP